MEPIISIVQDKDHGMKIKQYLLENLNLSMRQIKAASKEKRIQINGKMVRMDACVESGDLLQLHMREQESQDIEPEEMELSILYEDESILAVNKPPFMLVHPTPNHPTGTLANGAMAYLNHNGGGQIIRLINRLDRDTSGVVLFAKNSMAHMTLARSMENNLMNKIYLAIIHGRFGSNSGTFSEPIGKSEADSIRRYVSDSGQPCVTHYRTIEQLGEDSFVEVSLETGRTHQIRVHFSYQGHPIYGDRLYGASKDFTICTRQALHAWKLLFPHPISGDLMTVTAPMPQDMEVLKKRLS